MTLASIPNIPLSVHTIYYSKSHLITYHFTDRFGVVHKISIDRYNTLLKTGFQLNKPKECELVE